VAQLPREVVGSPSLEVFQNPGGAALRALGWGEWARWGGVGFELGSLVVFSNLTDSDCESQLVRLNTMCGKIC